MYRVKLKTLKTYLRMENLSHNKTLKANTNQSVRSPFGLIFLYLKMLMEIREDLKLKEEIEFITP
jgi:hypothetical protein